MTRPGILPDKLLRGDDSDDDDDNEDVMPAYFAFLICGVCVLILLVTKCARVLNYGQRAHVSMTKEQLEESVEKINTQIAQLDADQNCDELIEKLEAENGWEWIQHKLSELVSNSSQFHHPAIHYTSLNALFRRARGGRDNDNDNEVASSSSRPNLEQVHDYPSFKQHIAEHDRRTLVQLFVKDERAKLDRHLQDQTEQLERLEQNLIRETFLDLEYNATGDIVGNIFSGALILGLIQTLDFEAVVIIVTSFALLFFVFRVMWFELELNQAFWEGFKGEPFEPAQQIVATNVFKDFSSSLIRPTFLGLGQAALIGIYGWGLFEAGLPDLSSRRVYGFYWAGVLLEVAYIVGKRVRKTTIEDEDQFWSTALTLRGSDKKIRFKANNGEDLYSPMKLEKMYNVQIRFLLSTLVNTTGVSLIILALPIQLAGSGGGDSLPDPMDLVLNVIAAFYIFELDDLDDSVTFEILDQDDKKPVETTETLFDDKSMEEMGEEMKKLKEAFVEKFADLERRFLEKAAHINHSAETTTNQDTIDNVDDDDNKKNEGNAVVVKALSSEEPQPIKDANDESLLSKAGARVAESDAEKGIMAQL